MKGSGGVSSYQVSATKRRWKGFVIAVLGLVFLSMLVPLVFLLGFHNGFHSGFPSERQSSTSENERIGGFDSTEHNHATDEHNQSEHVQDILRRLRPLLPKESAKDVMKATPVQSRVNASMVEGSVQNDRQKSSLGSPADDSVHRPSLPESRVNFSSPAQVIQQAKVDESEMSCELRFGSYCLWRRETREVMRDSTVKKMKDLLFVARAYFPSIAKLPAHEKLSRELRQNIQDFERILSESTTDRDLPSHLEEKLQKMETAIAKAKAIPVDCSNVDKKFRQLVDLTEDEANFHTKQSSFLYQLAIQTMPKSLHCLSMRLTVDYFHTSSVDFDSLTTEKFADPELYHYVLFSRNILASSVVINSTIDHAKESKMLVFHVLTDKDNYYAMKLWFFRTSFKRAVVQVLNLEDYKPEYNNKMTGLSLPEEFRVTFQNAQPLPKMQYKTEYVSLFSYSHYLLPDLFKTLDKVVVLDDDILVQQDLTALWKIDMDRKVNGAVEKCAVRLGQLSTYLGRNSFDADACAWMSGLNLIDLARWRELNLSGTFKKLVQELRTEGGQYEAVASTASLLTFQDSVHALDGTWVLSGLGHDYGLDDQAIRNAAVLHYNGNMKPWLELGIPKYKKLWTKFLNPENQLLRECNVPVERR